MNITWQGRSPQQDPRGRVTYSRQWARAEPPRSGSQCLLRIWALCSSTEIHFFPRMLWGVVLRSATWTMLLFPLTPPTCHRPLCIVCLDLRFSWNNTKWNWLSLNTREYSFLHSKQATCRWFPHTPGDMKLSLGFRCNQTDRALKETHRQLCWLYWRITRVNLNTGHKGGVSVISSPVCFLSKPPLPQSRKQKRKSAHLTSCCCETVVNKHKVRLMLTRI